MNPDNCTDVQKAFLLFRHVDCSFVFLFVCLLVWGSHYQSAATNARSVFRGEMRERNSNRSITAHKYSGTILLTRTTSNCTSAILGFYCVITFCFELVSSFPSRLIPSNYSQKTFHLHPLFLHISFSPLSLPLSPTLPREDPQTHPFLLGRGNEHIREEKGVSGGNAPPWDAELG